MRASCYYYARQQVRQLVKPRSTLRTGWVSKLVPNISADISSQPAPYETAAEAFEIMAQVDQPLQEAA
jgi:hypothetical protein